MAAINVLDKSVYELIAAGEVIESPASVIKELIENSIDAKASAITVEIKNGGKTLMRVADNGSGIERDYVPTAFLRHATSKVSQKRDLDNIQTLGFRGEALASVCAVSRVEVFTKTHGDELGTRYEIAAGEEKSLEAVGCPDGTSVIVRDLFYNVPARLKFLKSDSSESNRIQEMMSRLAVSHPEISIKLIRDNKQVFVTAGDGKLYSAAYSVLGRDFANSLIPVEYYFENGHIDGYISKPLTSRPNRKNQLFFVNGRYVRSQICSRALEEAYHNSIMTGRFPQCVINIAISPKMMDVNVHPAKTEIRFSDNQYIYDALYFAVKQALEKKDAPTELRFEPVRHFTDEELYQKLIEPKAEQMAFNTSVLQPVKREEDKSEDLFLKSLEPDASDQKKAPWDGVLQPFISMDDDVEDDSVAGRYRTAQRKAKEAQKIEDHEILEAIYRRKNNEKALKEKEAAQKESENFEADSDKSKEKSFMEFCDLYEEARKRIFEEGMPIEGEMSVPAESIQDDEASDDEEYFEGENENPDYGDMSQLRYIKEEDFEKRSDLPIVAESELEDEASVPIVIGELFKTYIVAQCGDDMILVDKHAAHERYIFEQIKNDSRNLSSQLLLEPIMVMLSYDEYDAIAANLDKAEKLGFIIEPDVAPNIAVLGLPMLLKDENPTDILTEISQKLAMNERDPAPELYDDLYHTMACKAAIKAHDDSDPLELQKLVDSVYKEDIRYCPHGRPVKIVMPKREIEKQFKRIV